MEWFAELKEKYMAWSKKRRIKRTEEIAESLFQITEYNGMLWYTFGGSLFCPCSFVNKDDYIDIDTQYIGTLKTLRNYYIKRNTGDE